MVNVSYIYSTNLFGMVRRVFDSRGRILGVQFMVSAGHSLNQRYSNNYGAFYEYKKK